MPRIKTKKYFTTSKQLEAGKLRKQSKKRLFQDDIAIMPCGSVTKRNITLFHKSQDSTSRLSTLEISHQTVFLLRYNEFIAANTPERFVVALFDPFASNGLYIGLSQKQKADQHFHDKLNNHIRIMKKFNLYQTV